MMEELLERMSAATELLERAAERMAQCEFGLSAEAEECVGRIVATVDGQLEEDLTERLRVANAKLAEAENRIAELTAAVAVAPASSNGRKTLSAGMTHMLAKQGVSAEGLESGRIEAGSLDGALTSLSIEQRFAVKAELLRAGLLG